MGGAPTVRMIQVPLYHHFSFLEAAALTPPPPRTTAAFPMLKRGKEGEDGEGEKKKRNNNTIPPPSSSSTTLSNSATSSTSSSILITWVWIQVITYGNQFFWFFITEGAPPVDASIGPCAMATPPFFSTCENDTSAADSRDERGGAKKINKKIGISSTLLSGGAEGGGLGETMSVDDAGVGPGRLVGMCRSSGATPYSTSHMTMKYNTSAAAPPPLPSLPLLHAAVDGQLHAFCVGLARRLVHRMSKGEQNRTAEKKEDEERLKEEKEQEESRTLRKESDIPREEGQERTEEEKLAVVGEKKQRKSPPPPPSPVSLVKKETPSGEQEETKGREGGEGADVVVIVNASVSPEKRLLLLGTEAGSGFQLSVTFGNLVYRECAHLIQDPSYGLMTSSSCTSIPLSC